jgi:uncharacterized protein (DUF58 family)
MPIDSEKSRQILRRMGAMAEHLRLPFRSRSWRGQAGNWLGVGVGSSIDFQDHRPYLPGDDPRYIDWRAYARTGHYTMKLYREEVSPAVDLALDVSQSMFVDEAKATRVVELLYFAIESARRAGSSLHCFAVDADRVRRLEIEQALAGDFGAGEQAPGPPQLGRVPWRPGSMRIFISDILYAGAPEALLTNLSAGRARGVILAPRTASESSPAWTGNIEFIDCETQRRRVQLVSGELLERYARSYARHFALWREAARKHDVVMAGVPAEPAFRDALRAEALAAGAVELCA